MKTFIRIMCATAIIGAVGCASSTHERVVEKEKETPVVRERVVEQPAPAPNTTIINK